LRKLLLHVHISEDLKELTKSGIRVSQQEINEMVTIRTYEAYWSPEIIISISVLMQELAIEDEL
jgi:hypothetical protein